MVGQREYMDIHDAWVRGKSISEISRLTGRDRKTIRRLLHRGATSMRKPRQVSSKLDPFREYLLARMLSEDPVSNAEVLYDKIRERGYSGGRSMLKEFMHPCRAVAKEKATVRFETPPGRQAQVDWGTFKKPRRKRLQGFVMTLGWSRTMHLDFEDSQALAVFLACHERAFEYFGGVPEEILYDRVKTVWLHDDEHGDPVFHPGFLDFANYYGFRPRLCHPNRPQTKGKTENGIGYVRKNFWPRVRDYEHASDVLGLCRRWRDETCNVRIHGTTGERPVDRLAREGLRSINDLAPYRALVLERRRVARDCFVLKERGLSYPFPWQDLWQWYEFWSAKLIGYASRRAYIRDLVAPMLDALENQRHWLTVVDPGQSTKAMDWVDLDRRLAELGKEFVAAMPRDDLQDVGRRVREVLLDCGRLIADPDLVPFDEEPPKAGDAKAWLNLFLSAYASGSAREELRKLVRDAWDLAQKVTYGDLDQVDAFAAAQATVLVVKTIQQLALLRK